MQRSSESVAGLNCSDKSHLKLQHQLQPKLAEQHIAGREAVIERPFRGLEAVRDRIHRHCGLHLPSIAPQSDSLHALLWNAHYYLAFVFFATILLHLAAALFHALVRRDGVFDAMTPFPTGSHDQSPSA